MMAPSEKGRRPWAYQGNPDGPAAAGSTGVLDRPPFFWWSYFSVIGDLIILPPDVRSNGLCPKSGQTDSSDFLGGRSNNEGQIGFRTFGENDV